MSEHSVVHEVDGIREEDNKLPRWWLVTLFGAMVFALGYWEAFHTFKLAELPRDELASDMRRIRKAAGVPDRPVTNESLMASVAQSAASGEQVFNAYCVSCHGAHGEGKIGPNLTDGMWLHGGEPIDIHTSVTNGWPLKGMPAWQPVIGPDKVLQVTAYVLSLRDKNIPGKAPEGLPRAVKTAER